MPDGSIALGRLVLILKNTTGEIKAWCLAKPFLRPSDVPAWFWSVGVVQQENLNVDAVSGKSVNVISFFYGLDTLIWGTRTLDGNSQDWLYVPVRRMTIYLE